MNQDIESLLGKGPSILLNNINKIQDKVVRAIDDSLNIGLKCCKVRPVANFYEKAANYIIDIDLPGMDIKDIDISCHADRLIISGERKEPEEAAAGEEGDDEGGGISYIRQEIAYGGFERVFCLPAEVDENKVKAMYKNGILSVTIPKAKTSKAKKIKIET